ncbi:hypothetical protein LXL04_006262 [Taraxacum kok-saghyz]
MALRGFILAEVRGSARVQALAEVIGSPGRFCLSTNPRITVDLRFEVAERDNNQSAVSRSKEEEGTKKIVKGTDLGRSCESLSQILSTKTEKERRYLDRRSTCSFDGGRNPKEPPPDLKQSQNVCSLRTTSLKLCGRRDDPNSRDILRTHIFPRTRELPNR